MNILLEKVKRIVVVNNFLVSVKKENFLGKEMERRWNSPQLNKKNRWISNKLFNFKIIVLKLKKLKYKNCNKE